MAAGPESLLIGGRFYPDGALLWNCLAVWNGTTWGELGGGIGTPRTGASVEIRAVATAGSHHAMGGRFGRVRDETANHVARWDGQAWRPMGEGLPGPVSALAWQGHRLIAAGTAFGVAVWNGRGWGSLGLSPNLRVQALAVNGDEIFAAGFRPGATASDRLDTVVRWNGARWTPIADGVRAQIVSLHHDGQRLLVGGRFTEIAGVPVSGVAAWDGLAWTAVGSRLLERSGSIVNALATDGRGRLFVAGNFVAEPSGATCIAVLRDGVWQRLGTGLSPAIPTALAWWKGAVYAGGSFIRAGDKNSYGIGRWSDPQGDFEIALVAPQSVEPGAEFTAELRVHRVAGTAHRSAEILLPLPEGVSFVSADRDGRLDGRTVRWSVASTDAILHHLSCRLAAPSERTLLSYRDVRVEVTGQPAGVARAENTWVTPNVEAGIVRLVSPNGGAHLAGEPLTLEAECDPGPTAISHVTFHADDRTLATLTAPPWRFDWTPTEAGTARLRASCEDTDGETTVSLPAEMTVRQRPINDAFAARLSLDGYEGGFQVDPIDATAQPEEPDHGAGAPMRSLWWSFTPSRAGRLLLYLERADTYAAVYRGESVASLSRLEPDPVGAFFELTQGVAYAIAVDAPEHVASFAWSYRWIPAGGRIVSATLDPDGSAQLHFEGFSGTSHRLESSTDLIAWDLVETFEAGDNPNRLIVPLDASSPIRFFRVR
jgi:hypothetical protein